MNKTEKQLTPYVVDLQQQVDIFGGTPSAVINHDGLYQLDSVSLNGDDIKCIFNAKPPADIDVVSALILGKLMAHTEEDKRDARVTYTPEYLLEELGVEATPFKIQQLYKTLEALSSMTVIGRTEASVYQLSFISFLELKDSGDVVLAISGEFIKELLTKRVRYMSRIPIIESPSAITRSLYRFLSAHGQGGGRLVLRAPRASLIKYLGLTGNTKKITQTLRIAFKNIEELTGYTYTKKTNRGTAIYARSGNLRDNIEFSDETEAVIVIPQLAEQPVEMLEEVKEEHHEIVDAIDFGKLKFQGDMY